MKKIIIIMILSIYAISYDKVALVIGNENYESGSLTLPMTDAKEIGEFLEGKGFKVSLRYNLTLEEMEREIKSLPNQVSPNGVLLFYYSGHGSEVDAKNYLIPINDSSLTDETELKYKSIGLDYLIEKMQLSQSRINIVMIDACRNNPFGFHKGSKGLTAVSKDRLENTFLVFAGAEKTTIPDDGLFREMFIEYAKQPLSLGDLFTKIRNEFGSKNRNGIYTNDRAKSIFKFTGGDNYNIPDNQNNSNNNNNNNNNNKLTSPETLFQDNRTYHLGDENFKNWENVYGKCYSLTFNSNNISSTQYKLSLERFGVEYATIYVNNRRLSNLEKQYPRNGRKRPNYWSGLTSMNISNNYINSGYNEISICSELVENNDLDDLEIRNITLTKY